MENSNFFKFLWRANAVFLFVAGIALVGLLLMAAVFMIADNRWSDAPPPTVSTSTETPLTNEVFELRAPTKYGKSVLDDFAYFELRSGTDSYGKINSGSSSQLRNIGVYNLSTDTIHWVFPNAQQEIESFRSIGKTIASDTKDEKHIRTGFLLTIAKTLPDRSVARDLWSMNPNGTVLTKILSDIPQSPTMETYGEGQRKLIVETKTHIDIYPFDVDMLTVGKPTRVSMP